MRSLVMTGLGVGPRVVDLMDMREINDLMDYWTKHPPPHIATRQVFFALGGKDSSGDRQIRPASAEQFAAMMGLKLEASSG